MENPEEILQALDEFQKMRPSEIPRELEEYLCWVAKTGDPVYQWSLIKPLFREKLTRVMTDFYESCPSLELAPCPNVEQFNYDIMKCNLLELLESFANAPFTVQRICELLTAPRKEYNRVDKFMRAIEKNILVVSTREPGPAARRSENGDGMVNGSIDEDIPSSQPSHEVEMESWVKDCTSETTIAVSTEENAPLLDSVITAGKVAKIVESNDDNLSLVREKSEQLAAAAASEVIDSNAMTAAAARVIADTNNVTVLVQNQEAAVAETIVPSLSTNGAESSTAVADIPEVVMNEDTSSQPSLDAETEDGQSASPRKLQTTFQNKDFGKVDAKSAKFYADEMKEDADTSGAAEQPSSVASSLESEDSAAKSRLSFECQESVLPIVESLLEKRPRDETDMTDLDTGESPCSAEEISSPTKKTCIVASEVPEETDEAPALSEAPTSEDTAKMEENTIEATKEPACAERLSVGENIEGGTVDEESKENQTSATAVSLPEAERSAVATEPSRPIVEEPSFGEPGADSPSKSPQPLVEQSEGGVTIEEAMDDETRNNKSLVPDPIPIIEEPKDSEQSSRDTESGTTIIEELAIEEPTESVVVAAPIVTAAAAPTTIHESTIVITTSEEIAENRALGQEDITDVQSPPTEASDKIEPAESMEVDAEESMPAFQQDEPMDQEPGDSVKS